MYTPKRLIALLMCIALLLGLFGCGTKTPAQSATTMPTEAPTEAPTEPPLSNQYTQAAQSLRSAQALSVDLNTEKTIETGAGTFHLISDQELILTGIGTDSFAARMTEDLEINEYQDAFTEYYEDGTLYVNVYNVGRFQGDMTEDAFLERFAPAVLLDESLYNNVTAQQTDTSTTLTFSEPVGPESWALPEGAEFLSASGTAKITGNGILSRTTYTIDYILGDTTVTMKVSAKAEIYDDDALEAPPEPTVYKRIDSIEAPRLYDTAVLYMYAAETASATSNQTIVCQAADYMLTEQTQLHYSGTGADHISDIAYTSTAMSSNQAPDVYSQAEHFQDGVYSFAEGDGEPEVDTTVTPQDMLYYLQGHYDDNVPALDYIIGAKAEDLGSLIYLEIQLDEKWGQFMSIHTAGLIFEDPNTLNDLASAYHTTASSYIMVLDSLTGFPISAKTTYSGKHTIDGIGFTLSLDLSQTYRFADPGTYEAIVGESAPDVPATPLLYRVTGDNGQQMYLMGTIHVGDRRTAFLPDEVYDSLEQSDALAVEADVATLEQQMQTDMDFAIQLAALYINAGGTATKDLLSEDTYNKAVKLLKASGGYTSGMEYMKPYMWCNTIENFYMTLGQLSSDKGMDMRLLELANEQGMQILEVESALEQMEMVMNFSPELQILLLEDALEYSAAEYCEQVQSLYEMWCAGDEAALREYLDEESGAFTDAEKALYQEYLDGMIIQRNEDMLDVAVSYLESGETVFYAVGLAHLLQENGLVDTLREAGYRVEQVIYN